MKENNNKYSLLIGIAVTLISFILLLIGVKFILANDLLIRNMIAILILSVISGGISSAFIYFKLKIAVLITNKIKFF